MSRKTRVYDTSDDAPDGGAYDGDVDAFAEAVNDSQYTQSRASRADTLQARRRLERLLEERRLKRVIDDAWDLDGEEEEEE
ncbi:PA3496 family putative envelope integrity protein [Onishia taeanensis]